MPGLIPGASEGKGLGLDFLRHIERCSVIAHVIDTASFEVERDPLRDLDTIEAELAAYQGDLGEIEGYVPMAERPRVVILNKIDIPDGRELADMVRDDLEARGVPVFEVSAVSHEGLKELSFALAAIVEENRVAEEAREEARVVIRPRAVGSSDSITVKKIQFRGESVYQVRGRKPELWVKQTNFGNDEAVGYLADRLASAGVEDELLKAGAMPGDPVVIGEVEGGLVFDWEPSVSTGAELLAGRGEDPRLYERTRSTSRERRAAYLESMDGKERARQELRDEAAQGLWTDPGETD